MSLFSLPERGSGLIAPLPFTLELGAHFPVPAV